MGNQGNQILLPRWAGFLSSQASALVVGMFFENLTRPSVLRLLGQDFMTPHLYRANRAG